MTEQKPIGVFLRLPLNEEQKQVMYNYVSGDVPMEAAILAIGTPVTGGELEVVGMRTRDIQSIATSAWNYSGDVESDSSTYETQFLVRQSDALAKLAEKDAEIARLREALHGINDTAHNPSKTVWVRIEEVQKEAETAIRNLGAAP